jgi:CBS domain containing-hemolysin-like protein
LIAAFLLSRKCQNVRYGGTQQAIDVAEVMVQRRRSDVRKGEDCACGVVIREARSIPEPGQSFTFHGYRFQVLRKTRNRITALRVTPLVRKVTANAS